MNYDDCVRMVAEEAKHAERGVVIQDTAWEGYEEIPSWIMQGYSTMADEAVEQFEERPTHVFVPVSYTHLDVYKRQAQKAAEELCVRGNITNRLEGHKWNDTYRKYERQ